MKEERDYIRDIAEIRAMMERSSKFLTLSGWAGIMAGIYALAGAYVVYRFLDFDPELTVPTGAEVLTPNFWKAVGVALLILILAVGTAIFLSYKKARQRGEKIWNPTARRFLSHMAVPLVVGGLLILVLIPQGLTGLLAPLTLIFYGLALYNAGKFTYEEVKLLGFIQMGLGLVGAYFTEYGLLVWALGFGVVHIGYGIYMHYKYEQ